MIHSKTTDQDKKQRLWQKNLDQTKTTDQDKNKDHDKNLDKDRDQHYNHT